MIFHSKCIYNISLLQLNIGSIELVCDLYLHIMKYKLGRYKKKVI